MRTTVTLDPDVEALIAAAIRERGISFKQAINEAIRAGLRRGATIQFHQPTFAMGYRPEINCDRALDLAAALEEEQLMQLLAAGT